MKIRIIGGRKYKGLDSADFKQTPTSIYGLSQHTDLYEADLIVFLPAKSLLAYPTTKEMAMLGAGLPVSITKPLAATMKAIEAEKKAEETRNSKPATPDSQNAIGKSTLLPSYLPPMVRGNLSGSMWEAWTSLNEIDFRNHLQAAVEHTLIQCMAAVHAGAVFVLVIPADYLSWPMDGKVAQWIIPGLNIEAVSDAQVDHFLDPPSPPSSLLEWMRTVHINTLKTPWPFNMHIKVSRAYRQKGAYPALDMMPMIDTDDEIHFYPGAYSTRKQAKSLLLEYGKGGIIVMPPAPLQELIRVAAQDYSKLKAEPSLSLAFTGKSTIGKGSKLPRWEVHCNKKTVWLGPKAFLILLSCVVAAKLGQEGININLPQIKEVKLGTNIITPAKKPDRRGQQVNQNFSAAGINIHVLDTGRPKEKARYLILSSKLSPDSISLDPLKKSSNEAVKFLLNIHRKHS